MAKKHIDLERLRYGASLGLRLGELAAYLGMSRKTFDRRRKENDEIDQIISEGLSAGIAEMSELVFKRARAGEIAAAKLFLQSRAGWNSKQVLEVESTKPMLNIIMSPPALEHNSMKTIEAEAVDEIEESKTGLTIRLT